MQAVDDFTAEAQLDKAERQNVRQQVYSYCNEQLQAGEEIELESLSKELAGVSEVSFTEFAAEKGYELEESFPADRSTLRQLTKFAGSGGGLTINFDRNQAYSADTKNPAGAGFFTTYSAIKRERSRCAAASVCTGDAVRPEL